MVVACPCVAPCLDLSVSCTPLFIGTATLDVCMCVCACTLCAASLSRLVATSGSHTTDTGGWLLGRVSSDCLSTVV